MGNFPKPGEDQPHSPTFSTSTIPNAEKGTKRRKLSNILLLHFSHLPKLDCYHLIKMNIES